MRLPSRNLAGAGVALLLLLAVALPLSVEAGTRVPFVTPSIPAAVSAALDASDATSPLPGPGAFGLDISIAVNQSSFECLVKEGYSFTIVRLWRSICMVDANAVASVDAAWAAGMRQVGQSQRRAPSRRHVGGRRQDTAR
jgi:hypothetical protein